MSLLTVAFKRLCLRGSDRRIYPCSAAGVGVLVLRRYRSIRPDWRDPPDCEAPAIAEELLWCVLVLIDAYIRSVVEETARRFQRIAVLRASVRVVEKAGLHSVCLEVNQAHNVSYLQIVYAGTIATLHKRTEG